MARTFQMRVGITRRYGDHEIYFEIAEQVEVSGGQERREIFLNLQAQLEDQITVYEKVSLPHVQLPQRNGSNGASSGASDTFVLDSIVVESKGGKRFVSAAGGKWKKHGVPVYPECSTDIDFALLDYGRHDFAHLNMTVTVDIENGSAKRCRSIR